MKITSFCFILFTFLVGISDLPAQQKDPKGDPALIIDSLINVLKIEKEDTGKVKTLNLLGVYLFRTGNFAASINYSENALRSSNELIGSEKDAPVKTVLKNLQIQSHLNLGRAFDKRGNYPDALKHLFSAIKLAEEINKTSMIANIYNNLGQVYDNQGNYPEAIKNYSVSMEIYTKNGNKEGIAGMLNNIGSVFQEEGKDEEALTRYKEALKLYSSTGNRNNVAVVHNNIGIIYHLRDDFAAAEKEYAEALKIRKEISDNYGIAETYLNMGSLEIRKAYAARMKNRTSEANSSFKRARDNYRIAIAISKKDGIKGSLSDCYVGMAEIDSATGNFEQGFSDYKTYILYRDSLRNEESTKKQTRLEMQYVFDKKQMADSVKTVEEKKVAAAELRSEKNKRYSLYGGLFLVLAFAGFIFNRFRVTQRQKKIIESQKEIVEEQKIIVEEKNKDILDSIHYARRIQRSLLPTEIYIDKNFKRLLR